MDTAPITPFTISPGDVLFATDIHGQLPHFIKLLEVVKGTGARMVLGGDLIDRSPQIGWDLILLETVEKLLQDPESHGLESFSMICGNHCKMLEHAVDYGEIDDWRNNGGDVECLELMAPHVEWIRKLPYYITIGDTLFAHAGVFCGKNPAVSMRTAKSRDEFVWNRSSRFFSKGPCFEKWSDTLKFICFGHTPRNDGRAYRIPNGICVDSGCFFSGVLSLYNRTTDQLLEITV